jgi:hypothetical protein
VQQLQGQLLVQVPHAAMEHRVAFQQRAGDRARTGEVQPYVFAFVITAMLTVADSNPAALSNVLAIPR